MHFIRNYSFYLLSKFEKTIYEDYYYIKELEDLENEEDLGLIDPKLLRISLMTQKNVIQNDLLIHKLKNFLIYVLTNHFVSHFSESLMKFFTKLLLEKFQTISLHVVKDEIILYKFFIKYKRCILDYKKSLKNFYRIKYNSLILLKKNKSVLYSNKRKNNIYIFILRKKFSILDIKKQNFVLLFKLLVFKYKNLNIQFIHFIFTKYINFYIYMTSFIINNDCYIHYIKFIKDYFVKKNIKLTSLVYYNDINLFLKENEYLNLLFNNSFSKQFNKLNIKEISAYFRELKHYLIFLQEHVFESFFFFKLKSWICFYFLIKFQKNLIKKIKISSCFFFKLNSFSTMLNIFFPQVGITKGKIKETFTLKFNHFWSLKELFLANNNLINFYFVMKNKKFDWCYILRRKEKNIIFSNSNKGLCLNSLKKHKVLFLIKKFNIFNPPLKYNISKIGLFKLSNFFKLNWGGLYCKNEFYYILNLILELEDKYDFKKKNLTYQEMYFIHNYDYDNDKIIDLEKEKKLKKDLKYNDFKLKYHAKLLLLGYPHIKKKVSRRFRKHYRHNRERGVFVHYNERINKVESSRSLINKFHELNIFNFYKTQFQLLKKGIFFTNSTQFSFFKFLNFFLLNMLNKNLNNIEIFLLFGHSKFNYFLYMKFLNNLENAFFIHKKKKKVFHKFNWDKYLLSFNNLYMKSLNKKVYNSKTFNSLKKKKNFNNENNFFF